MARRLVYISRSTGEASVRRAWGGAELGGEGLENLDLEVDDVRVEAAVVDRLHHALEQAVGIPEEQLRRATGSAVCKVNIDSDGRLAMTAAIRKVFGDKPGEFDPRKYLDPARSAVIAMVKYKNEKILGSADRA